MKRNNINKKHLCENCGHNHIAWVGDLGKDNDEEGYDRLSSCASSKDDDEYEGCGCENWKNKVVGEI